EVFGLHDGPEAHADSVFLFDQTGKLFDLALTDLPLEHRHSGKFREDLTNGFGGVRARLACHMHGGHTLHGDEILIHYCPCASIVASIMLWVSGHADRNGSTSFISDRISLMSFPASINMEIVYCTACVRTSASTLSGATCS